jgi:predicted ATPase
MKILRLDIEGYRSLRKVTWEPGDLNILIGPNGSGKTNLVKLLELIAVSAQGRLKEYVLGQGGIAPLLWDQKAEGISIEVATSPVDPAEDATSYPLRYVLELRRLGSTSSYRVETEFLKGGSDLDIDPPLFLGRDAEKGAVIFDQDRPERDAVVKVSPEESLLSTLTGPFLENEILTGFQKNLASWVVYQGLDTGRDALIRRPVVTRHETRVAEDGGNLVSVLHTFYTRDREFKNEIDRGMKAAFGEAYLGLEFPPVADQLIQLGIWYHGLSRIRPAADLSDGTLRFLFLLTILANPQPPCLMAIEEPEVGLHPGMLPIVAEFAADAANRSQVILTTHSPEFLDSFRDCCPTTTILGCFDGETKLAAPPADRLESWMKSYRLGEYLRSGEFDNWLKGEVETEQERASGVRE